MDWPLATAYSMPRRDANDGMMGIDSALVRGMTESHAPESAVSSISTFSSSAPTKLRLPWIKALLALV